MPIKGHLDIFHRVNVLVFYHVYGQKKKLYILLCASEAGYPDQAFLVMYSYSLAQKINLFGFREA